MNKLYIYYSYLLGEIAIADGKHWSARNFTQVYGVKFKTKKQAGKWIKDIFSEHIIRDHKNKRI